MIENYYLLRLHKVVKKIFCKMKVFLAVLFVALVGAAQALSDDQKEKIVGFHKVCFPKAGVAKDLVDKMRAGEFVEDDKLKAYCRCMFEQLGFMNEAGDLLVDVLKSKIPEDVDHDKAIAVIEKCQDVGTNADSRAFEVYQCYRKTTNNPIHL